jgi:VIT1/CCC1 family predicted Fe2+/Mn2+ transporter
MGALIPLAISLAPEIGRWLFGTKGEQTAQAVAQVVQSVTGTSDEAVAQQVVARDPKVAAQLRIELAKIAAQAEAAAREADLDTLKAGLADVADARRQTVALAQAKSAVQWAPAIVSFVVLATFGVVMWAALTRQLPAGSETILNMLLGTLAAMATSVVGYWVGSSAGSSRKTDLLYHSAPADAAARGRV